MFTGTADGTSSKSSDEPRERFGGDETNLEGDWLKCLSVTFKLHQKLDCFAFSLAASYRQAPTEANQWKSKMWFSLRIPVSVDVCMRERNKKGIKILKTAVTGASVLASLAAAAAARQHSGEGESSRSRFLVSSKRKHSEAHPSSEHFFFFSLSDCN